jgi:hypothetical protein
MIVGLLFVGAGCNRQDAECLGRIGKLVGQRLERLKPTGDSSLSRALPVNNTPADNSDPSK